MKENNCIKNLRDSIQTARELSKWRKCGCMKESLKTMKNELLKTRKDEFLELLSELETSIKKMETIEYT